MGFGISYWDIRNSLSLRLESYFSRNIRNFFIVGSFYFVSLEIYFLKYKKFFTISVFWNIRIFRFLKYMEFFSVFLFSEIQEKLFFWKYKKFLNVTIRKFHFSKCKEFFLGWIFFIFLGLGLKAAQIAPYCTTVNYNLALYTYFFAYYHCLICPFKNLLGWISIHCHHRHNLVHHILVYYLWKFSMLLLLDYQRKYEVVILWF